MNITMFNMRAMSLLLAWWTILGHLSWRCYARTVVVDDTNDITYEGTTSNGVEHYQNIHYAHDTSGINRFMPPRPYLSEKGSTVNATTPGASCPQPVGPAAPFFEGATAISENCFTLRVTRPTSMDITSESKLPVLVLIHGGLVIYGSAYDGYYDPSELVRRSREMRQPCIYVAINYRLSIFGFTSSMSLRTNKAVNVGLRDQREGLQWIQNNIAAFGGDPKRVMVFGQSAGGTFIGLHRVSYGGKKSPLFQQAFQMSGPPGTAVNMTRNATAENTVNVARHLGCTKDDTDTKMISCLQEIAMEDLLKAELDYATSLHPPYGGMVFIPFVDGDFLPDLPSSLLRRGDFQKGWSPD